MTAAAKDLHPGLEIRAVHQPKHFLGLQPGFYRGDPDFVPPLPASDAWQLDPRKNPFFRHAEVGLFGAFAGDRCVGRISTCRDRLHDEFHGDRVGFFGHFEAADAATAAALVAHAAAWCRQRGAEALRGPVDLSTNNRCGLLVEGDAGPPVMMMPYNPPHYAGWLEATGLAKAKDLLALYGDKHGLDRPRMDKLFAYLQKRTQATFRTANLKRYAEECTILWQLYQTIWERNWGFVPMPRDEFMATARDLKRIAHASLLHIAEVAGKPAGFIVALPDVNQAVLACRGRLLPFGWWKFLRTLRATTHIRVLTLGVVPELRRAGIDVMMMHRVMSLGIEAGFNSCEAGWILEDNRDMLGPLLTMGLRVHRRYRIYEKSLR